jgi:pyridoxamine 5'-phosphate oxidase
VSNSVQAQLARLKSLSGSAPSFEPDQAPKEPGELFQEWFDDAVAAGIEEPHAMTLSSITSAGTPDARVLILKDFDPIGRWAFASSSASTKGAQLAQHPVAALTFYWAPLIRSVRMQGTVTTDSPAASRADFLARSTSARAIAISGRQSSPLSDRRQLDAEIAQAHELLDREPGTGADTWRKYWLTADTVEFWQGGQSRQHTRLEYHRHDAHWTRQQLRP